jgi:hypothetical protein
MFKQNIGSQAAWNTIFKQEIGFRAAWKVMFKRPLGFQAAWRALFKCAVHMGGPGAAPPGSLLEPLAQVLGQPPEGPTGGRVPAHI